MSEWTTEGAIRARIKNHCKGSCVHDMALEILRLRARLAERGDAAEKHAKIKLPEEPWRQVLRDARKDTDCHIDGFHPITKVERYLSKLVVRGRKWEDSHEESYRLATKQREEAIVERDETQDRLDNLADKWRSQTEELTKHRDDACAEVEKLTKECDDLKKEIELSRVPLRICLGHFFDDTPLSQVAKDVTNAFHHSRIRLQQTEKDRDDARAEVERLKQHVCDGCLDESGAPTGWKSNAIEGRHVCACIGESGPYEEQMDRIAELERLLLKHIAELQMKSLAGNLEREAQAEVERLKESLAVEAARNDKLNNRFMEEEARNRDTEGDKDDRIKLLEGEMLIACKVLGHVKTCEGIAADLTLSIVRAMTAKEDRVALLEGLLREVCEKLAYSKIYHVSQAVRKLKREAFGEEGGE